MSLAVATRYARALVDLGEETGTLDALLAELEGAAAVYTSSRELQAALANPLLSREVKQNIVVDVAGALSLSKHATNTVRLLVDRRRVAMLPAITRRLRELVDRQRGIIHAEVISAVILSESFYERLRDELQKVTGKQLSLRRSADPSLIGGVVVRIGDTVIDGSLRTRLDSLKQNILSN